MGDHYVVTGRRVGCSHEDQDQRQTRACQEPAPGRWASGPGGSGFGRHPGVEDGEAPQDQDSDIDAEQSEEDLRLNQIGKNGVNTLREDDQRGNRHNKGYSQKDKAAPPDTGDQLPQTGNDRGIEGAKQPGWVAVLGETGVTVEFHESNC